MIRPLDGTANADSAVWRDGCWHLVRIAKDGTIYSASCSCGWTGPERVRGPRFIVEAETLAYSDGEHHAWAVDV